MAQLHFAHVLGNTVITVSTWTAEPTEEDRAIYAPAVLVDCTGPICGPGWLYDGSHFKAPAPTTSVRIARVYEAIVRSIELHDHAPSDEEHAQAAPVLLIACSEEVAVGWRYDAETGAFTAP